MYPHELESGLSLHPKVVDVAVIEVIDVSDAQADLQLKAIVQPAAEAEVGDALEHELIDFLKERVARDQVPRSIDFTHELPRTSSGVLYRHALRACFDS
ncbi:AMP-binding enzyme C-terminal domain-containing protein [Haloechinothrix alba]|uniref:AMP-binding enzyme C-terminal domain-containing protein n=1 Tax=Haloechinothrix alba TaxID=664784 RepID=A0A239ALF7_9PSEU|nr:hypothetical protein [Haloechinothrix alba]SNR96191.1 AMP-binding enzyme C-terminal domain-containing protein [Haloechinothrix alba]